MQSTRKFFAPSDRVKSVDLHPSEPWMAVGLRNGEVNVWNYNRKEIVRSFKVSSSPVRAAVFIVRKGWLVTGSDDKFVRVFDYTTGEKVEEFEAHDDFITSIAVHPTQSFILTAGDDKLIKQWNWDKDWAVEQIYEGHTHYVMQIAINPKDSETFASASLDNTVKMWQMGMTTHSYTLEGHDKGVNCVSFYNGQDCDKSILVSGGDDHLVKVWKYESKKCIATIEGHTGNVTSVQFHSSLPLIISTAESFEEGTVRVWNVENYRMESVLDDDLGRAWCVQTLGDTVAVGYDRGCVVHTISGTEREDSADENNNAMI